MIQEIFPCTKNWEVRISKNFQTFQEILTTVSSLHPCYKETRISLLNAEMHSMVLFFVLIIIIIIIVFFFFFRKFALNIVQ